MTTIWCMASLSLLALLAQGCQQSAKESANKGNTSPATQDSSADQSPADDSTDITASNYPDGFYTGFDGTDKFSLLLPGFRKYTVTDASIAKIDTVTVTVSQATIDEIVAKIKEDNPDITDTQINRVKGQFSRQRTIYKLTPLKAGRTTLTTSAAGGHGGPGGGSGGDVWQKGDQVALIVETYTADEVAAGKDRYTRAGDGNKRPCASCHETGEAGAPPHELGDVMQIPDVALLQWIKTGKLNGRVAKIQHTWEFADANEEKGILAYLRTKQTDDAETLIKLEFENQLAQNGGKIVGGGGFGPPPGSQPTTTSTSTTPSTTGN